MAIQAAKNVLELIGATPLVKINRLVTPGMADLYGKLESRNPGGSVKDRICLSMIEDAERRGVLKPGMTIVEPTSGNTGIGLAMVAAVKGYKCILTMPDTMSVERQQLLECFGAQIVLAKGPGMQGAVKKAQDIVASNPNCFMPQQFENPANPDVHRRTTAQEILRDTDGALDAFVAGVGTGGTITGVGEVLKKQIPRLLVVAVEPARSNVLSGGPRGPHRIQGIGAGFVPAVFNRAVVDEIIAVTDEDAYHTAAGLAKKEGLLVGISAGAAVWAALRMAEKLGKGKSIVVILPDTGERYLSTHCEFKAGLSMDLIW
ncbi:MAG: cysteine synthase A [Planctomycetes bacterium]|nr:cysteine synthase A [Planctomycetota bacterium]